MIYGPRLSGATSRRRSALQCGWQFLPAFPPPSLPPASWLWKKESVGGNGSSYPGQTETGLAPECVLSIKGQSSWSKWRDDEEHASSSEYTEKRWMNLVVWISLRFSFFLSPPHHFEVVAVLNSTWDFLSILVCVSLFGKLFIFQNKCNHVCCFHWYISLCTLFTYFACCWFLPIHTYFACCWFLHCKIQRNAHCPWQ